MEELKKIKRVIAKAEPTAPHAVWVVLDANTGQNALAQVKAFDDALGLTGLVLTKLDGTAKGGVVAAIAAQRPVPLAFIGGRGHRRPAPVRRRRSLRARSSTDRVPIVSQPRRQALPGRRGAARRESRSRPATSLSPGTRGGKRPRLLIPAIERATAGVVP
jgi:hypothetical protein